MKPARISYAAILLFATIWLAAPATAIAGDASALVPGPQRWASPFQYGSNSPERILGDVNGDQRVDAVNASGGNFFVALSNGQEFVSGSLWKSGLGSVKNLLADVNGDGKADAIGFDGSVWRVALSTGLAFANPVIWPTNFTVTASSPTFAKDMNGDGYADLVARSNNALWISPSTGSGFLSYRKMSDYRNSGCSFGSTGSENLLGDVNGDGLIDTVARQCNGWVVGISRPPTSPSSSQYIPYESGYQIAFPNSTNGTPIKYALAPIVGGDNRADVVAVVDGSWWVAPSLGAGFGSPSKWNKSFSPTYGGSAPTNIFAGDLNSDSMVDPVAVYDNSWWAAAGPSISDQIRAIGSGWSAAGLSDDFNDPSYTDSKWDKQRYETWLFYPDAAPSSKQYHGIDEDAPYEAGNSTVSGGNLEQKITRIGSGASATYKAASVNTLRKYPFMYGYVEASIKIPKCSGCWPAFWMLSAPDTYPPSPAWTVWDGWPPEVDIFETFAQFNDQRAYFNTVWGTLGPNFETNNVHKLQDTYNWADRRVVDRDLSDGFHTFGLLWTSEYLQFFIDGIGSRRVTEGVPVNKKMYLILSLQRKGSASDYETPTTGATMYTDYLRVYK